MNKDETLDLESYDSIVNWLFKQLPMYQRVGEQAFKKNLNNILALCEALGNPQNDFKSIHIAGTNGKGTTAHLIAAGLSNSELKVGLYSSPHYMDYRERIKINGVLVSKEFIVSFIKENYTVILDIQPSFFEITVAMAFDYFRSQNVDVAIIETGLGGRLDSTNIITPILSIITNISLDHESMLGNTIEAIAYEKAGIIKPGIPIIIGEHQELSDEVFIEKADKTGAELLFAQDDAQLKLVSDSFPNITYNYITDGKSVTFETDLMGEYQTHNLLTAISALDFINERKMIEHLKWNLSDISNVFKGLNKSWHYMGRFQVLSQNPLIIGDSAHNIAGIKSVLRTISTLNYNKIHFVLGFVSDKTLDKILPLFPIGQRYYFVKADIPRAMNEERLALMGSKYSLFGKGYKTVEVGLNEAIDNYKKGELIYIGGSIFVLGEILKK